MTLKKIKPGYLFSTGYTNYIFVLLFLLYMFDYLDRTIVSSMFTFMEKDWGLTHTQCGLLVSSVYWAIVILTFPISILVDRWSRRKTISVMAIIWSLATGLCAFTGNFAQLFLARLLIGVGEAGYAPGGTAMIAGLYPQEKRSQMIGIWNASIPLGMALGMALGGLIASTLGWKHAFGLVAIPGFIVAVLFYFIKDYKTVGLNLPKTDRHEERTTRSAIINEFLQKPSFIYTSFGLAAVVFVTTSLMTWLPRYLQEVSGLDAKQAGFRGSIVLFLAIVGGPLGGFLTDRWRKHSIRARLLFPTLTTSISAVLLFIAVNFASGLSQYIILLIFGISVTAFSSAAIAVTQDVIHAGLRAVSYSIAVVVQNLLGASMAPIVVGILYDRFGIQQALLILPFALVIGALLFYLGSRHYESDFNKVPKIALEAEK